MNNVKEIYFITGNQSKFKEAKNIIENLKINLSLVPRDIRVNEIQDVDPQKVLLEKARQAYLQIKKPVLVDDTGIYFEEYNNFPGTLTKILFKAIGFDGIKRLLQNTNSNAFFKTMICYKDDKVEKIFSGVWKGKIIDNLGKNFNPDWEYNGIFLPEDSSKVLAEMSMEERATKSHRKKAFDELVKFLKTLGEKNGK